ncbi:MAG: hypothetical protein JNN07_26910 [Verrucomicrobiales bacterium]|nr:hypothetical protein [Verrucomicrobiales bacterium]
MISFTHTTPRKCGWHPWSVAEMVYKWIIIGGTWADIRAMHPDLPYGFEEPSALQNIARGAATISLLWANREPHANLQQGSTAVASMVWSDTSCSIARGVPSNVVQQAVKASLRSVRLHWSRSRPSMCDPRVPPAPYIS